MDLIERVKNRYNEYHSDLGDISVKGYELIVRYLSSKKKVTDEHVDTAIVLYLQGDL